jgi:hypothetical protein
MKGASAHRMQVWQDIEAVDGGGLEVFDYRNRTQLPPKEVENGALCA